MKIHFGLILSSKFKLKWVLDFEEVQDYQPSRRKYGRGEYLYTLGISKRLIVKPGGDGACL